MLLYLSVLVHSTFYCSCSEIHMEALQRLLCLWSEDSRACVNRGAWGSDWYFCAFLIMLVVHQLPWCIELSQTFKICWCCVLPSPFFFVFTTKHFGRLTVKSQHLALHASSLQIGSDGLNGEEIHQCEVKSMVRLHFHCLCIVVEIHFWKLLSLSYSSLRWSTLDLKSPAGMRTLLMFTTS